jgi:hypothetical protein
MSNNVQEIDISDISDAERQYKALANLNNS